MKAHKAGLTAIVFLMTVIMLSGNVVTARSMRALVDQSVCTAFASAAERSACAQLVDGINANKRMIRFLDGELGAQQLDIISNDALDAIGQF